MALLDVVDVLTDPDFVNTGIKKIVRVQTVGNDGVATYSETTTTFTGVVTNDTGDVLMRLPGASYVKGTITIHTREPLNVATSSTDADRVEWMGKQYTVTDVQDYAHFGRGFHAVTCEPVPMV